MSVNDWGALTPERVAGWINFDRGSEEWAYREDEDSMPARQAEGVAGLWNKLALHGAALLADEVGMGKTFQALGVMALLWKMRPDARVLVMAPNRDICRHWAREYGAFVRDHYRDVDHLVRNVANGGPVHEPQLCWKLEELEQAVQAGTGSFFITTIYSLSGLVPREEKDTADKQVCAAAAAERIHRSLIEATGGRGFDLVVVDEAHYFRNAGGGSQRASAARAFFGEGDNRLGQASLLMTATPSHSSEENISAILGYVTDIASGEAAPSARELLQQYAIRRLRRMKGRGRTHDKYSYRNETLVEAVFDGDPAAELFFALYQKMLVRDQEKEGKSKRYLYGYLEGFESFDVEADVEDGEGADDRQGSDFEGARDTKILRRLSRMHAGLGGLPAHPKYDALVKKCVSGNVLDAFVDLHEHKHLVFVRRIPSVREIAKRVNDAYDCQLGLQIVKVLAPDGYDGLSKQWEKSGWSRAYFNATLSRLGVGKDDEDTPTDALVSQDEFLGEDSDDSIQSRISNLFVVKKEGRDRSTDCSNVRLRFQKPDSLFSLLLEPASDYRNGAYRYYFRKMSGDRARDDYGSAALDCRLALHDELTRGTETIPGGSLEFAQAMPTLWGSMYALMKPEERAKIDSWLIRDPGIAENFGNYLKSGYLFASPVMVELYCWYAEFRRLQNGGDAQQRYLLFVEFIGKRLESSLAFAYFRAALDTFETLCEKITDHALSDWRKDWRVLTGLQSPALYASGEVKDRQRLIMGFNSPFYPNVLAATSVFQEGVNLHLQCRKVHHYGIAWTPGDNEQRVGRVDRLFGKVNAQLERDGQAELAIHYPYLARSFDEEQLASFIQLKHGVEERMDACRQSRVSSEIDLRSSSEGWKQYLRKPRDADDLHSVPDPFSATFGSGEMPAGSYQPCSVGHPVDLVHHVRRLLAAAIDPATDILLEVDSKDSHPGVVSLVESVLQRDGLSRKQPIVAEIRYSSTMSALASQTVYLLVLRSPLASRASLLGRGESGIEHAIISEVFQDCPLARPVLESGSENGHFYLHVRVDLPLFALDGRQNMLAAGELRMAMAQIRQAADNLEWHIFEGRQDLRKEDIPLSHHAKAAERGEVAHDDAVASIMSNWQSVSAIGGRVVSKQLHFSYELVPTLLEALEGGRPSKSRVENLLRLNHCLPMFSFDFMQEIVVATIAYPADYVQPEEQHLLELWFGHLEHRLKVSGA